MGELIELPRLWHNAPEAELRKRGRRSKPGEGEIVDLFLMLPYDTCNGAPEPWWEQTRGEDFAECWADIVLKVKRGVSKADLIRCLKSFIETFGRSGSR